MSAFFYSIFINWKMNLRSKDMLIFYYAVPLIFYLFVGGVFISIMPDSEQTLIQGMTVFGITMGGVLGSPNPLVEYFGSDIKRAYQVGKVPLWTIAAGNYISASLHLFLTSVIILLTAPVFFQAVAPANLGMYFIGMLLTILTSLGVGMLFGLVVKNASKVAMVTQLVFLPSILLSGAMIPTEMLPKALQIVGNLLPATWGLRVMCAEKLSISLVAPLLGMLVLFILLSAVRLKQLERE